MPAKKSATKKKRVRTERVAATFSVKRASEMTRRGRRDIAKWLRQQARDLEFYGENYAPAFTARWSYTER